MEINNIFIKSLTVDNYKSLKDSTIELQMGLNIIIGKNGAGKSNLLDFIYNYTGYNLFGYDSRHIYSSNTNFSISVEYDLNNKKNVLSYIIKKVRKELRKEDIIEMPTYELTINKIENNKTVIKNKRLEVAMPLSNSLTRVDEKIADELEVIKFLGGNYIIFELPQDTYWLTKPNRLTLSRNDPNFAFSSSSFSFFHNLELNIFWEAGTKNRFSPGDIDSVKKFLIHQLSNYSEATSINSYLKNFTPITEIRFNPNLNIYSNKDVIIVENLSIDFLIDGDWMPWSYLSDGTKRLFYLISECISSNQGVILIEEPESGIHPHQLSKVLDFLKEQSRTKQIIVSTHSPLTLDILKEDELNRIIIAKYNKGTKFSKLGKAEIIKAKKYMNEVGELSYYWLHSDLEK